MFKCYYYLAPVSGICRTTSLWVTLVCISVVVSPSAQPLPQRRQKVEKFTTALLVLMLLAQLSVFFQFKPISNQSVLQLQTLTLPSGYTLTTFWRTASKRISVAPMLALVLRNADTDKNFTRSFVYLLFFFGLSLNSRMQNMKIPKQLHEILCINQYLIIIICMLPDHIFNTCTPSVLGFYARFLFTYILLSYKHWRSLLKTFQNQLQLVTFGLPVFWYKFQFFSSLQINWIQHRFTRFTASFTGLTFETPSFSIHRATVYKHTCILRVLNYLTPF